MSDQVIPIDDEIMPTGAAITIDDAVAWESYLDSILGTLTADDHYHIAGNLGRHRSGWVKLRRAMGISIQIRHREKWTDGEDWGWDFEVRATLPRGRFEEADGSASYLELMARWEDFGKKGPEPNRHIVRARALTRASNRATQGLLGLPETKPAGRSAHVLAQQREAAFANLLQDANGELQEKELEPYYRDTGHVADTLRGLGYSVYKAADHFKMAKKLVRFAEELATGANGSAEEHITELFGDQA